VSGLSGQRPDGQSVSIYVRPSGFNSRVSNRISAQKGGAPASCGVRDRRERRSGQIANLLREPESVLK